MREIARYRQLDQAQIAQTLGRLRDRIAERFPGSGLSNVAGELVSLSEEAFDCVAYLRKPNWPIRVAVGIVIAAMVVVVGLGALSIRVSSRVNSVSELVQTLDASINDVVFLGVAIFFLVTVEARLKRRKALGSLQQLRSVVHIVDMHQLTKDPERLMSPQPDTDSSPARSMTAPELGRYLDYCSEMLSLTSKIAASFIQSFNDPVVLSTVNEIETLVTGLSGKIWQKITLLERASRVDETRVDAIGRSR
ncbi:MAG TPA: hypothetical protein VNC18_13910 [Gemmatimonadaceae bacterium]|jgi:hypothetical protein|nr:hypothetical protein [Gemmatimonadaceae bacterium]